MSTGTENAVIALLEYPGPGAARVIRAVVDGAGAATLPALSFELEQVRKRLGKKRAATHADIYEHTKSLFSENNWPAWAPKLSDTSGPTGDLNNGEVIGTSRRRIEVQVAVCSQWIEAAKDAVAAGDEPRFANLTTRAAVAILWLQGAADALEIKQSTSREGSREGAKARSGIGNKKREKAREFLKTFRQNNPSAERDQVVPELARHLSVGEKQASRYLDQIENSSESS